MLFMLFLCPSVLASNAWDETELKYFECDVTTTGKTILLVGSMFIVVLISFVIAWSKIPVLEILTGFVSAFFGWNVAQCFYMANIFYILIGLILIFKGFGDGM